MEEYPLEIQGAWIVLLCKLWWSETRGESTKSLSEWARILREKTKKTKEILEFFQKKNIANIIFLDNQSPNQNVTITSRRMVKDHKISELRRHVGKMGGNPGLLKIKENKENLVNQTSNQNDQSPVPVPVPSTNKKIFLSDSIEYRLSNYLYGWIKKNNPSAKEPNIQTWCRHIDLAIRIDKRNNEEIKSVIAWCQKDPFWFKNILSTETLRKQFDRLKMQMEQTKPAELETILVPVEKGMVT